MATKNHPGQMLFEMKFNEKFENFINSTREICKPIKIKTDVDIYNSDIESCYAVASAVKKAIRVSGLTREQLVDAINSYFNRNTEGAKTDPPECLPPMTIGMLNNYLSKPAVYRFPAYLIFAVQAITKSLEPSRIFVEAMGGEAINADESRQLKIAKLNQIEEESRILAKQLKKQASY